MNIEELGDESIPYIRGHVSPIAFQRALLEHGGYNGHRREGERMVPIYEHLSLTLIKQEWWRCIPEVERFHGWSRVRVCVWPAAPHSRGAFPVTVLGGLGQ